jgi:hypothetical protein
MNFSLAEQRVLLSMLCKYKVWYYLGTTNIHDAYSKKIYLEITTGFYS